MTRRIAATDEGVTCEPCDVACSKNMLQPAACGVGVEGLSERRGMRQVNWAIQLGFDALVVYFFG